jgi:hypothetical protein
MNFLSRDKISKKLQIRKTLIEITMTLKAQNKTKINEIETKFPFLRAQVMSVRTNSQTTVDIVIKL